MRKLTNILYMFVAVFVAAAFTACSDDDNFEWAKKVSPDNPGVYFASSNEATATLTPEEYAQSQSFTLTLKRLNNKGELTVPIIVDKADKVFTIPATATFQDGANETTLEIKYPGMEMLHTYTLIIHVDEAYTNPYVATDGMASFKYEASLIRWVKLTEGVFKWNKGEFADTRSEIYWLEGKNRFRINNFLNSGINWEFSILAADPMDASMHDAANFNPNDRSTWHGIPSPYNHWAADPAGKTCWFLMQDADNGIYAQWYPDGEEFVGIDFVNFWYDTSDEWWGNVDMRGSATEPCFKLIPFVYYTDETDSGYTDLYGYWDPIG